MITFYPGEIGGEPYDLDENNMIDHPLATLFPLMGDDELKEMARDIKNNGLLNPIVLYERKILDGRNRYRACKLAGHKFEGNHFVVLGRFGEYEDETLPEGVSPLDYVLSHNLHRRHLTAEQKRAVIAAVLKQKPGQTNRQAAAKTGSDHKTVGKVRKELEGRGEIPHVETREDTRGRQQPAKKKGVEPATAVVNAPGQTILDDFIEKKPASGSRFDIFDESEKFHKLLVRRREEWPEKYRKEFALMARTCIERMEAEDEAEARIRGKVTPAAKENSEGKTNGEIKARGVGVERAHEALNYLFRIPPNDPQRERGFQLVMDWIKNNP